VGGAAGAGTRRTIAGVTITAWACRATRGTTGAAIAAVITLRTRGRATVAAVVGCRTTTAVVALRARGHTTVVALPARGHNTVVALPARGYTTVIALRPAAIGTVATVVTLRARSTPAIVAAGRFGARAFGGVAAIDALVTAPACLFGWSG